MPRKTLKQRIEKLEGEATYAARKAAEWQAKATGKQGLANALKEQAKEAVGGSQ